MLRNTIKYLFLVGVLTFSCTIVSQNYFDSLNTYVSALSSNEEKVLAIKAIPFDKMNDNASAAIKIYQEGVGIAKSINNKNYQAAILEQLSIAHYYNGDYDMSVKSALHAVNIYEELGHSEKSGAVYASIGYQMKRRDLQKAYEYMKRGVKLLEGTEDLKALSAAYNNYGVLFEMDDKIDSALFFYNKSLDIVVELNDSIGIPYALNNIAGAYVLNGDYQKALPYYKKALDIREKRLDANGMAENYTYYGDFYFKQDKFQEAIPYYQRAYELAKSIKYMFLMKVTSGQLSECYAETGDYMQALKMNKKSAALNDSLINIESNKTIHNLEIQFESEKNEKMIAEQRAKISAEQLRVKQRNYLLWGLGAGFIFIVFGAIYVYKQQKFKQERLIEESRLKDELAKITTQNELHQERLRISRDLHDNIGSQLTFIISSVDNLKYLFNSPDEKVMNKLSDVSSFTRTTITQLRDTIWALNKDEITFEDLKSRLYNYLESAKLASEHTAFHFESNLASNYTLNSIQAVSIYRIVQESINNTMKYAAATNLTLSINETTNEVIVSIKDDGVGFKMSEITLGNGLENMKNRASSINADFEINSTPERGTIIAMSIKKEELTLNKSYAL